MFTAFRTQLRALGYEEGRDVVLEFHLANGSERLAALAQAIAAHNSTDLVLADGRAARKRSASIVDRVLKGASPADTPFEQPTRVALVVNVKTAKALGLTVPQSVLLRERIDSVMRCSS